MYGRHVEVDKQGNILSLLPPRVQKLGGNFKLAVWDGRRPHLLYGSFESLARMVGWVCFRCVVWCWRGVGVVLA